MLDKFRFLTAGESHGKCLTAIIEGIPSGFDINPDFINSELKRRQGGYGRGGRMKIETDTVEITSGVRFGKTLGSPVTLVIQNKDFENWEKIMSTNPEDYTDEKSFSKYRPRHDARAGGGARRRAVPRIASFGRRYLYRRKTSPPRRGENPHKNRAFVVGRVRAQRSARLCDRTFKSRVYHLRDFGDSLPYSLRGHRFLL